MISRKAITDGLSLLLKPVDNYASLSGGEVLTSTDGKSITVLIGSIIQPTVDSFSGDLLYIDNRNSFYQSPDQLLSLQTVIKF